MNDTLQASLRSLNIDGLGGNVYDLAAFYFSHGKYENSIGLLLLAPDSGQKRNLAKNLSRHAMECHQFDYAFLAAHLSGDDNQKKKIEQAVRVELQRGMENTIRSDTLERKIRDLAHMNGGNASTYQQRYDYCKRRVIEQIRLAHDPIQENILSLKSCIRKGNEAIVNFYLYMITGNKSHTRGNPTE